MVRNKRLLKILAVLILLVMCVCVFTGCENKSKVDSENKQSSQVSADCEQPIEYLVEGLKKADANMLLKAFPSFISDYMVNVFTDDYLKQSLSDAKEQYGDDLEISYKTISKVEIPENEIKDVEDRIKKSFNEVVDITKGYVLNVENITKGNKLEKTTENIYEVYEIEGNWYVLDL